MTKTAPAGKPVCIYCQSASAEELDHTLPQTWEPVGTAPGIWVNAAISMKFRRTDLDTVGEKFVRGLHYERTGKLLPVGTKFEAVEPPDEVMRQAGQGLPGGDLTRGLAYRYSESEDGD